jgi:hypothetical protein
VDGRRQLQDRSAAAGHQLAARLLPRAGQGAALHACGRLAVVFVTALAAHPDLVRREALCALTAAHLVDSLGCHPSVADRLHPAQRLDLSGNHQTDADVGQLARQVAALKLLRVAWMLATTFALEMGIAIVHACSASEL